MPIRSHKRCADTSKIYLNSITYRISFLRPILDRFLTLQDAPKAPPRHLKTFPRRLKTPPRRSKTVPKTLQDGSKALREASKRKSLSNSLALPKQSPCNL